MDQGMYFYYVGLGAEALWVGANIIVLALVLRLRRLVQHACLNYLALGSALGVASILVVHIMDIPHFPAQYYSMVTSATYGITILDGILYIAGMWQLLHWIPQLLDLKVLDQRNPPEP